MSHLHLNAEEIQNLLQSEFGKSYQIGRSQTFESENHNYLNLKNMIMVFSGQVTILLVLVKIGLIILSLQLLNTVF